MRLVKSGENETFKLDLYKNIKEVILGDESDINSVNRIIYEMIPVKKRASYVRLILQKREAIPSSIGSGFDTILQTMIEDIEQELTPEPKYKVGDIVINGIARDFDAPWKFEVMRVIKRKKIVNGEYWGYELRRVQKSYTDRDEGELMSVEELEAYQETCGVNYESIEV